MAFDFNLDTTIKELYEQGQISVRTLNCLHYAGMENLGEVLSSIETPMDLLNIRNFGRKSYTEMEPRLLPFHIIYSVRSMKSQKKVLSLRAKLSENSCFKPLCVHIKT